MTGSTVFVVGAGASCDFQLPLGSQLIDLIIDDLRSGFLSSASPRSGTGNAIAETRGIKAADRAYAAEIIAGLNAATSIDRFLDTRRDRPGLVEIGKIAIAIAITAAEANCPLARLRVGKVPESTSALRELRHTWIGQLTTHLGHRKSPAEAASIFKDVSFVVFNYDRCIEQYLFHAFHWIWNLPVAEARALAKSVDIQHVYGHLGELSFEPLAPARFGSRETSPIYAAQGIRTFTEGIETSAREKIQETVAAAEKIIFLGFGFDPMNMEVLFPSGHGSSRRDMWGTLYFSDAEKNYRGRAVRNLYGPKPPPSWLEHRFRSLTARDFVFQMAPLLFQN